MASSSRARSGGGRPGPGCRHTSTVCAPAPSVYVALQCTAGSPASSNACHPNIRWRSEMLTVGSPWRSQVGVALAAEREHLLGELDRVAGLSGVDVGTRRAGRELHDQAG